jgi:hypothetical protein
MELVLHFGAHKTGTSLIQKYMRDNQELMHKNSVWFTLRSETNKFLGWGSPEALRQGVPALKRDIDKAAKRGAKWFVVSHENALGRPFLGHMPGLYPEAPTSARILGELLQEFKPLSIYYLRDQEDFIESYYLQTVHQGGYLTFRDWRKNVALDNMSWRPLVRALGEAFGTERSAIRSFAAEIGKGQSGYLLSFFRTFMGKDLDPKRFNHFDYPEVRNPSIGKRGLAIALAANPHLSTHKERKLMRVFLQDHFSNKEYPRPVLLKDKEKASLRKRYGQENKELLTE